MFGASLPAQMNRAKGLLSKLYDYVKDPVAEGVLMFGDEFGWDYGVEDKAMVILGPTFLLLTPNTHCMPPCDQYTAPPLTISPPLFYSIPLHYTFGNYLFLP